MNMTMTVIKRVMCVTVLLCLFSKVNAQCTISNIAPGSIVYTCPDAGIHCIGSTGAQGDAWIKYSPLNNGQLKKPFVFVEGLDLNITAEDTHRHGARGWPNFISGTTDENDLTEKVFEKAPILINELLARGYDVIYLDHSHGGTYMQDNARVFVDLIKKINLQKTGNEQIIVAAASMGGQTAKYGISLMENENYKHCIADYISIDSPHQGANIPLGFQAMLKEYKFLDPNLQSVYDGLSLPAAQQLLLSHLEASSNNAPHANRAAWLNDLNAVGNYPKHCRKVAITSGNINGVELFPESSKLLTLDVKAANGCSRGINLINIDVYSQPGNAGHHVLYSRRPNGASFGEMWTNDQACGAVCPVCLGDPSVFYDFEYQTVNANSLRLDNCPGGKRNTAKQFVDKLNSSIASSAVPGFLDAITDIEYNQEFHGFIPTTSALDVNTSNLFENVQSYIGANTGPRPAKYPFDAYYGEAGDNKFHVEITGDAQNGNIKWLLDEATRIKTPIANPLTNAAPNSGVYNYARYENKLLSSLIINNGGKLLVNANLPSEYDLNTLMPYKQFVNYNTPIGTTYTLETCYCDNVVVEVGNNGEFILGDNNNGANNNKAVVLFHEGSKLFVRNGGKLTIRKGSKLIMEENTILTLEQGAQLLIEEGAQLIVKGTSQFTASGLVTLNGGKIIQEPLSELDLTGTGILVVNNNSAVIIQSSLTNPVASSNAVLTYEKDAVIQLNGSNAVLELNGRLHIGDNATFSIPYYGAATGYIKFNRGNAWWDNWAPGNAHITCGTNSKINLTGQNRVDKLIEINQQMVALPKNLARFDMTQALVEFNAPAAMLETSAPGLMLSCSFKGLPGLIGGAIPISHYTRGLVMFGQAGFKVAGCDFINLGYGLQGALFYGGNKLNVITSKFQNNYIGIYSVGAGGDFTNNHFTDNAVAISCSDITLNTAISNNNISGSISDMEYYGTPADPTGVSVLGSIGNVYMTQNNINKTAVAVFGTNTNLNLKCNQMQSNSLALYGNTNSNVYMSTTLNSGNNNASDCYQFASFNDAKSWEPYAGYNSFKITNASPCSVRYVGTLHQLITVCPKITNGSLVQTNSAANQHMAGFNFWKTLPPSGTVESEYNQLKKATNYVPITVVTTTALPNQNLVDCHIAKPTRAYLETLTHPMDPIFASITIYTNSFPGTSLQSALLAAMTLKNDTTQQNHLDDAASLLQEIVEIQYSDSLDEGNRYLLELAWQQLLETVSQLKERDLNNQTLLIPLAERFPKLLNVIDNRLSSINPNADGYNKLVGIAKLDRALVYRLAENRVAAINQLNELANTTALGAQYQNLCQYLMCIYSLEQNALDKEITLDQLFKGLLSCEQYKPQLIEEIEENAARKSNHNNANEKPLSEIAVYPNPSQGRLVVDYDLKQYTTVLLEIEDIQGKKIASYQLHPENTQFVIEHLNLESGIYIYKVNADNQNLVSRKLVIMK